MIFFTTGDLGAVQASGNNDLNTLGAGLNGLLDGTFHGAAKTDTFFHLEGNPLRH